MRLIINILIFTIFSGGLAQENIQSWVKELETTDDSTLKKELLLKIIDHYQDAEKIPDSALKYINAPIQVKNDSLFYAEITYRKAVNYNNNSKFDLSVSASKKAARLYKQEGEGYSYAKVKSLQGSVYQAMFKNQLALESYDEAKEVLVGEDKIQLLSGYAAVYSQLNDLDTSIKFYDAAYNESIKQNNERFLFNIHNGMAVVYYKNENPKKSIESLEKALDAAKKEDYILGQVVCLHNLGHKYQTEASYERAISYFKEAIQLIDQIDYKLIEGQIYYKYADCLVSLNKIDEAIVFADKAEVIFNTMKSSGRLPYALRTQASIQKALGNTTTAISLLEEALEISSENEISSLTADLYLKLAENYSKYENSTKTFEAFTKHITIKDSLAKRKKSTAIERVKAKFESSEREYKLKQENELLAVKNTTSYYRNILLAFALLGVVFFFYRQRRINQVKQKALKQEKQISELNEKLLQDKVKHKNSQITEYAILLDERNKFLEDVKHQINEIRDLSADSTQKRKINDLQYYIKDNVNVNKEKVDLDKKQVKSIESFRYNLEQRFPKLTDKEITICRLLILNLTSKQISQKMEITVQSVNNYRSSIRKKIDLGKEQNLKRFLKKI